MPIEADLIIAQSAHETEAGVSALGMAWQVRPPGPIPWALVVILHSSRDLIGTEHPIRIRLEREDGQPMAEGLADLMTLEFDLTPTGLTEESLTSPVIASHGFNLLPVPLEPGTEYRFRLWVDGETHDHWVANFRTTPP
jgi:hypothetical protein